MGGYLFWIGVTGWLIFTPLLKSCDSLCAESVVKTTPSPNGEQIAELMVVNCGATTDFFSYVDIKSKNQQLTAQRIFSFVGGVEEMGIEFTWQTDTNLEIGFKNFSNLRTINPEGKTSADLTISYQYLGE